MRSGPVWGDVSPVARTLILASTFAALVAAPGCHKRPAMVIENPLPPDGGFGGQGGGGQAERPDGAGGGDAVTELPPGDRPDGPPCLTPVEETCNNKDD